MTAGPYKLTPEYRALFDRVLAYAREQVMVAPLVARSATCWIRRPIRGCSTPGCTSPSNKGNGTSRSDSTGVYITADRHLALAYASTWTPDGVRYRSGSLYLVESEEREPDQDLLSLLPGVSFQTRSARVIGVAKARVPFDRERSSRKLDEVVDRLERAKRAAAGM